MSDVTFFWIAFSAYLAAMFVLVAAVVRRGGSEGLARAGRALVWLGLGAHTVSIAWRSLLIGTEPLHMFFERMAASFSAGPAWQAAVYVLLFAVACLALGLGVVFRRRRLVWLPVAAVALVLEMILLDFLNFTRMPIEKTYEYLSLASWCAAVALVALSPTVRLVAIDAALGVVAALLMVFTAIQPKAIELQLVPALQSYWLFIHVSLTSVAYAIFGVAFGVAAMFLIRTYDPAAAPPGSRRRVFLGGGLAKAAAAVLVLVLVLGGIILPFREVAYAPHELLAPHGSAHAAPAEAPALPPVGAIQVVRYGAALLGAYGLAAYVFFWIAYPFLRPKDDRSGFGSYVFVVSTLALFAACLAAGGFVSRQERAIDAVWEQQRELGSVADEAAAAEGASLTRDALAARTERLRALSRQARTILSTARWLPLTPDNRAALASDPQFLALQALYRDTGEEWKSTIRYKDIKEIGRRLTKRADTADALMGRLSFPAGRREIERLDGELRAEAGARESKALLPRRADGQVAAFVGLSFLVAVPIGLALWVLLPRVAGRLPEAARLDRISYSAVAVGYPLFTFGALFAGAIWAHFAWGSWWSWDPKEVGSLVGWVLFTIYLHQRYREGLSPRTAAVAAILGFVACTLSLAGNSFLGGLHAYS